jgi:hypothetical protein
VAAPAADAARPEAAIRVEAPPGRDRHRVSAVGLPPAALAALAAAGPVARAEALAVFTGDRVPAADVPAVLGRVVLDEGALHFEPRFPFVPALAYTARLSVGEVRLVSTFRVDGPAPGEPPRVVAVHPSAEELPENTLRLYVHFSRPMAARGVHRHVRLVGPDGGLVPLAFVEIEEGLWDRAQTRLTLLFHPGRVKRAVAPGEALGPPLRAGREYRLVVDGALADAAGVPLGQRYERRFRATEADRASPRAEGIRVEPPLAPRGEATVVFPEPLDAALLRRWVWIEDEDGQVVPGRAEVGDGETRWTFVPDQAWGPGRYAVRVRAAIEDRAGNRFDRLFDREAARPASDQGPAASAGDVLHLPFQVRALALR